MSNTRTNRRVALGPIERQPGQQEAVMLAAALGLALDRAMLQPGCVRCVRARKIAEAGGDVELPLIAQSVTWLPGVGPVCYGCFG